ncbi:hypothetical protein N7495_008280 [Penicillium taxi]|uniref:uncharacterized protein n=1 Tax=Penicillium taxi TaxID=168475 RepID=UPI002545B9FA|nr:uncharacterized protein N7495_008280 [Penicillium taxi]KAJ5888239.1 hypothetical protein N7495_008280 [Penicillium taxi]
MRTIEETRKRWDALFLNNDTAVDLQAALRSEQGRKLCNDGLRSICWKIFLLFEGLEREQWSQKLAESREAYTALRAHFLKYIEHPDDLGSTVDPLADDEHSPWQTLRTDEKLRAEILQDVDRCLQENPFFQEPATKSKLTDVLFIYSKLNPDVGYRQGMHELLAPILWVIDQDTIQKSTEANRNGNEEDSLMVDLLDEKFIEHDSFSLFLCVMQTARIYYEHSETNGPTDVIPIVSRCEFLHKEALMIIDQELAEHLEAVDVLPQIFLTRWMRLLFGREFPFEDVLTMWDILFAHGLRSDIVDFTCIAMLLRIRWQLLKSDYSGALTMLLRYPSPLPHSPHEFMHDALYLEQNPTADRGAHLIAKYSGKQPGSSKRRESNLRFARKAHLWEDFKKHSESESSSSRNSPKSLETLLQDVSQGIQRRTESWGVAKAVRGAVTEARKNMQTMQHEPIRRVVASQPPLTRISPTANELSLEKKISCLEERNKALSSTLSEALTELRLQLAAVKDLDLSANDALVQALARAESVQTCLENPSASVDLVARPSNVDNESAQSTDKSDALKSDVAQGQPDVPPPSIEVQGRSAESGTPKPVGISTAPTTNGKTDGVRAVSRSLVRPSLSDAGFSWMLEGSRNVASFVSSASEPPEQTRQLDRKLDQQRRGSKSSPLFGKAGEEKSEAEAEDELAMSHLKGVREPL